MDNTSGTTATQEYDDDPTGLEAALRCLVCGLEATEGDHGRRVGDDEWLCHSHRDAELTPQFEATHDDDDR